MAKLSKKDRELIAAESLGRMLCDAIPKLDGLLSNVTQDEDVKNVIAGSFLQSALRALARKKTVKR